jgi:uncharacterized membrane protein YccF (DUF307 family)
MLILWRGLVLGGLILAGQWWVITHAADDVRLYWTALSVPAAVSGLVLARLVTLPAGRAARVHRRRGGGHR